MEIIQGGCVLVYRPGSGTLHRLPDALSRNPPLRDRLILARVTDWNQLREVIRGVTKEIESGFMDSEDPPPYTGDDLPPADVAAAAAELAATMPEPDYSKGKGKGASSKPRDQSMIPGESPLLPGEGEAAGAGMRITFNDGSSETLRVLAETRLAVRSPPTFGVVRECEYLEGSSIRSLY